MCIVEKLEKTLKIIKSLEIERNEIISVKSNLVDGFIEVHLLEEEFFELQKQNSFIYEIIYVGNYKEVFISIDSTKIFCITEKEL